MESFLAQRIESMRYEMIDRASTYGSFTHEKVVSISQRLDRYIVVYQKLKQKKLHRVG
ncbi:aspartyl-phosphate phosphatase Spo0E family protein [Paenibacillus sp. OV219]|uniref:aspartyl-phosphate phosphatase Spo0E family protein n=1 Tax=Paenibacillus sp. OV219 TaxID=1884377 RepID=UPI0008C22D42|nr:aspartyl-phosphate phosphatase Spo0E family protein [Paenibacillus sp. OV219]SEO87896.1 Spo0E like sporulation regulatory protein [Paenibacillus sp. OV219]